MKILSDSESTRHLPGPKTKKRPEPSEVFRAAVAALMGGQQKPQPCAEFKPTPAKPG